MSHAVTNGFVPQRWLAIVLAGFLLACAVGGTSVRAQPAEPGAEPAPAPSGPQIFEDEADQPYAYRTDTRSPRAVLRSLQRATRRAIRIFEEQGFSAEVEDEVHNLQQQLTKLFDLRDVPRDFHTIEANEAVVLLREALARVELPRVDEVPGEDEMAARVKDGKSPIYRIPGTIVEIGLTEDGPHEGRYQFRRETRQQARSYYEEVKDYPYQPDQAYVEGLYYMFFLAPGPWVPDALIQALPDWWREDILGHARWQLALLCLSVVLFAVVARAIYVFIDRVSRGWGELWHRLFMLVSPIAGITLAFGLERFLRVDVSITGDLLKGVLFGTRLVVLFYSVTGVIALGNAIAEIVLRAERFTSDLFDQQLVRLSSRLLSVAVGVVIMIEGMQRIGFSLATLVAGAGVGGLAVALAAQGALKNIIAGIELSLDRPFSVGQRVSVGGFVGMIEEIGLRSTKVRTLAGHQVTIPNETMASTDIENIGRRPYIRRDFDVTVTYDTPPEKIKRAVEIIEDILALPEPADPETAESDTDEPTAEHPNAAIHAPDFPPRVFFNNLNADSLNIGVFYWHHPPNYWDYLAHAQWVNMQIMERFNQEGIDFAFPTQTLHLAGDDKRPLDVGLRGVEHETRTPSGSPRFEPAVAAIGIAPAGKGNQPELHKGRENRRAPIEEELLHSDEESGATDEGEER